MKIEECYFDEATGLWHPVKGLPGPWWLPWLKAAYFTFFGFIFGAFAGWGLWIWWGM